MGACEPSSDDRSPGELVLLAARSFRRRQRAAMEPLGLVPHQARALRVLGNAPAGQLRAGVLAEQLGIAPRSVTDVVDALAGRGLVSRMPDPADRRAVMVCLTVAGKGVLERLGAERAAALAEWTASLSADERRELVRLLARLVDDGCP